MIIGLYNKPRSGKKINVDSKLMSSLEQFGNLERIFLTSVVLMLLSFTKLYGM